MTQTHHPPPVYLTRLTKRALKELKDDEEIQIEHPLIHGLVCKIRREFQVMDVLGVPTMMYGQGFLFADTDEHNRFPEIIPSEEMVSYVDALLREQRIDGYRYQKRLLKKGLHLKDIILVNCSTKGMICPLENTETFDGCVRYAPLKKDGKPSKSKRILYGDDEYEVIS